MIIRALLNWLCGRPVKKVSLKSRAISKWKAIGFQEGECEPPRDPRTLRFWSIGTVLDRLWSASDPARRALETKDYHRALEILLARAQAGDAKAQYCLGVNYEDGLGVEVDLKQAFGWYRKSAEAGVPDGQNAVGCMFESGQGVPQDFRQAAHWYEKSALQDNPLGLVNLGVLYEAGKGVQRDLKKAVLLYAKGATCGNGIGAFNLGLLCERVLNDYRAAALWYGVACEMGCLAAVGNFHSLRTAGLIPEDLHSYFGFEVGTSGGRRSSTQPGNEFEEYARLSRLFDEQELPKWKSAGFSEDHIEKLRFLFIQKYLFGD